VPKIGVNGTTSVTRWTHKKELFVERFLELGDGAKAARAAGYSHRGADRLAWRLLHRDPLVKTAVEEGRLALRERNEITVDDMIVRFDADHDFAIESGNANAAVRASEMKAKLAGLLVDRIDQRSVGAIKIELVTYDGPASAA
jgi:phage terminase small subunit